MEENEGPLHVVFFVEKDMEKAKYTLKHLACRLAVEPLHVHVFMRNGRDAYGHILDRKMVAKLAETRQFLQQSQQTFAFVKAIGRFTFEEVRHDKSDKDCLDDFVRLLREDEASPHVVCLKDDLWHHPWQLPS